MRSLPERLQYYAELADAEGLPDPIGRALYLGNRLNTHRREPLEIMRRAKPATAEKWRLHWLAGGSLRALRSVDEQRRLQRERKDRFLSEGDRLRIAGTSRRPQACASACGIEQEVTP